MELPQREWVIDTCVLMDLKELKPENLSSISFIMRFIEKSNHVICSDYEEQIITEYEQNINIHSMSPGSIIKLFWEVVIINRSRVSHKNTSGFPRQVERYLQRPRFDPDDIIFVKVAYFSQDKRIVSKDSDYTPEIKAFLKKRLGINVYSPREALEIIEGE